MFTKNKLKRSVEFKFCCQDFLNRINNLGKTGFSFLAINNLELNYFVIQGRFEIGTKISTIQTGIKYCPFCGLKLKKLITKQKELFLELAKEHKKFNLS